MTVHARCLGRIGWVVLVLALASPAAAQIGDQLSAYTGENATGYLTPLADAIGADLNGALYHSAYIPESGFHMSLETRVVGVIFADDQRTFRATTQSGFSPETTVDAPTVVGPGEAVIVLGDAATEFAFPGGFDLNSFAIAVPQIRIGSYKGTEALIRYIAINTGDVEIGDLALYGFGLRHSISQYFEPTFPVDLAAGFFWQKFTLGEDLIDSQAMTFGVQASKRYPAGFVTFEPYASLSVDTFSMDVSYKSDAPGTDAVVDFTYDADTSLHLTAGLSINAPVVSLNGEYSFAGQNTFAFGVGFGF
jgi:hypothetical protein